MRASIRSGLRQGNIPFSFAPAYGDGMVLQAGRPVVVRGFGPPGARVEVSFKDREAHCRIGPSGEWLARLPASEADGRGGELIARLSGAQTRYPAPAEIRLRNVLIGEVWFCSGQSNMEMGLGMADAGAGEIQEESIPGLRFILRPKASSPIPIDEVQGQWKIASRDALLEGGWEGFSAIAYHFGRLLHKALGVPIGIIQAAYGGAKIQPFIGPEFLRGNAPLRAAGAEWKMADRAWRAAGGEASGALHPFNAFTEWDALKPATVWNAMVHPFRGMALRGVLWYQGESNVGDGMAYKGMMAALAASFRSVFDNRRLPLYFTQIAPWRYGKDSDLFELWEAQKAASRYPGMGMAVTADLGDLEDIHPRRKRLVGERLASIALRRSYGKDGILDCGPSLRSMAFREGGAVLEFRCAPGGLRLTRGGSAPTGFELAGTTRTFTPAQARIEGDRVILSWEGPGRPSHVRYCRSMTAVPDLSDASGIPTLPFGPWDPAGT
jgi:sialate O-acetylesterase